MKILTSASKAVTAARAPTAQSYKVVADPYLAELFDNTADGKTILLLGKDENDTAEAINFIQTGKVKITVVSPAGHEAVVTILGPRAFFGEGASWVRVSE
jgi:CRP-like cAMP-binding protein